MRGISSCAFGWCLRCTGPPPLSNPPPANLWRFDEWLGSAHITPSGFDTFSSSQAPTQPHQTINNNNDNDDDNRFAGTTWT